MSEIKIILKLPRNKIKLSPSSKRQKEPFIKIKFSNECR